jgi:hypothetical protein
MLGRAMSNWYQTVVFTKNGNLAPLPQGAGQNPRQRGLVPRRAFRALDTAKRRQVEFARSRIVPGTFVGPAA